MSTIAAISTAPGVGGIGIIRISGEKTFEIIKKIFIPKNKNKEIEGYKFKYGHIVNPKNNEIVDEVLVSYFKKPYSYTTEDMCEINSHGGNMIMKEILEICLESGANLAEPGEFTKRAFLNGRIDLSQAESIIDIINSKTQKESRASVKQLEGFLSIKIKEIRKKIMNIMVDMEADFDYPEYNLEGVTEEKVATTLEEVNEKLQDLINTFDNGKIIKEGINVAIIGKPNAGKSSLLNALLKEERAIVSEYKGTTRDSIEEIMNIDGIPVRIIDTAGIRNANDEVEKIGIKRAKDIAQNADLVIAIFDISSDLEKDDLEILNIIKNRKSIIVLNKIDLNKEYMVNKKILSLNKKIIKISALKNKGIDQINKAIIELFNTNEVNLDSEIIVTNVRHKNLIMQAKKNAENAIRAIKNKTPIDIVSIDIKAILDNLGEITGDNVSDSIINEIFAKFCLGK